MLFEQRVDAVLSQPRRALPERFEPPDVELCLAYCAIFFFKKASSLQNEYERRERKQSRPSRSLRCTWVLVSRKRVEVYVALKVGLLKPAHELKRHERVHRPEHEAILGSQPRRAVVELHACKTTQIQGACMRSRRSAYLVCVCVCARA